MMNEMNEMNETNEFDNNSKEFELAKGQFQHHTKAGIKKKTVRRNFKKDVLGKTSVKTLIPVIENESVSFGCESLDVVNVSKKSHVPKTIIVMSRKGPIIKEKRPIGKKGVNRSNSPTNTTAVQKQQRKGPNDIKNLGVGYTVTNVDRNRVWKMNENRIKKKINKPDPILTM